MRHRKIEQLLGHSPRHVGGHLYGWPIDCCVRTGKKRGLAEQFSDLDSDDQLRLVKRAFRELGVTRPVGHRVQDPVVDQTVRR